MNKLILALLALTVLFMGCTDSTESGDVTDNPAASSSSLGEDSPVTQDDVMAEIDSGIVSDEDDVEIGEMI